MEPIVIQTEEKFNEVKTEHNTFVLLKHSLTCPISANAKKEYEQYSEQANLPVYILYVQKARELSNSIADYYQVKHESPQVLFFKNDQVVWHDSHGKITEPALHGNINPRI